MPTLSSLRTATGPGTARSSPVSLIQELLLWRMACPSTDRDDFMAVPSSSDKTEPSCPGLFRDVYFKAKSQPQIALLYKPVLSSIVSGILRRRDIGALQGTVSEDYLVMCREHNPNEGDLVEQMPPMPDAINQERSASRPRGRNNPGQSRSPLCKALFPQVYIRHMISIPIPIWITSLAQLKLAGLIQSHPAIFADGSVQCWGLGTALLAVFCVGIMLAVLAIWS